MMPAYWFILVLLASSVGAPQDHRAAIAYIRAHQTPSGGFVTVLPAPGKQAVPSIRTTRTAVRALQLLGADTSHLPTVFRYVEACYSSATGGFSDRPGLEPDPVSTSVGLMILQECHQPLEPYLEKGVQFMGRSTKNFEELRMVASAVEETKHPLPVSDRWEQIIDEHRNSDGSYGKGSGQARTTALHVVAKQRLGLKIGEKEPILKVLRAGQREDGGFGNDSPGTSHLEACYRIVRLLSRLDAQPDRPEALRAFIDRCKNADGGYGVQPNTPSSLHGTYYATIVRHWLDGGK
ncbi:MAG TPA: prenyltransferase/squalene oxidase repeat-containing protein [Gemmatales bacterium]|nr:prenyltransferase/squalene oxidase repeat-containing protein [Gemmatales bacterium]